MKKILVVILAALLVVSCSGGSSKESTKKETTTTTVKKYVKADDDALLLSVLPTLAEAPAGFTETQREAEATYDEATVERCPGVKRASFENRYISAVDLQFKKPSSNAYIDDGEFIQYSILSFKDSKSAKEYLKVYEEVVTACKDHAEDLGDGWTTKYALASPGKVSQAEKVSGEIETYFVDGEQNATYSAVNAQKGRFVVMVSSPDMEDSATRTNAVLAKL